MPKVALKVSGADTVMDGFVELSRALSFTGGNRGVNVYIGASDRSARQNIAIAQKQAALGRDPWHLSREEVKKVTRMVRDSLNTALRASKKQYGRARAMTAGLHGVGKFIVTALEDNLLQMDYGTAVPKPLTPAYAKRKRREVGFTTPMLLRYGGLLRAIKYRLTKG